MRNFQRTRKRKKAGGRAVGLGLGSGCPKLTNPGVFQVLVRARTRVRLGTNQNQNKTILRIFKNFHKFIKYLIYTLE